MNSCKDCLFHCGTECRRFPPLPIVYTESDYNRDADRTSVDSVLSSAWPKVRDDDWCGEYQQCEFKHFTGGGQQLTKGAK